MQHARTGKLDCPSFLQSGLAAVVLLSGLANIPVALADDDDADFRPGNLLLSRVIYDNNPNNVTAGVTALPPNCMASACVKATAGGTFPVVFNNAAADASFGITSKIVLDQLTPFGERVSSLEVPNSSQRGIASNADQMVSSFSSKSEVALNLSTDGNVVTFMGYLAPDRRHRRLQFQHAVCCRPDEPRTGQLLSRRRPGGPARKFRFTKTNAYSGNNGRAAILNNSNGANVVYTSGNAGNGSNPQPNGIIVGAGAQILTAGNRRCVAQDPALPTPVGSFSVTQLGDKRTRSARTPTSGVSAIFNNVVYLTKGSGSNGINTVYFLDTSVSTATAIPWRAPTASVSRRPPPPPCRPLRSLQCFGVCRQGRLPLQYVHPQRLADDVGKSTTSFPFGVWFADAKTLYVTDEGNGTNTFDPGTGYTAAAAADHGRAAEVGL